MPGFLSRIKLRKFQELSSCSNIYMTVLMSPLSNDDVLIISMTTTFMIILPILNVEIIFKKT